MNAFDRTTDGAARLQETLGLHDVATTALLVLVGLAIVAVLTLSRRRED